MNHEQGSLSRRAMVVGAVTASLVANRLAAAPEEGGPEAAAFGDGVAGGGTFVTSTGEAEFSLVAFAQDQAGSPATFVGTFALNDASIPGDPLVMTTDFLSGYSAPDDDRPDRRRVTGWARANGSGPFPFVIDVDISSDPSSDPTLTVLFGEAASILLGSGQEKVCDCGGFDYRVKGTVAQGGVTFFTIP